MMDGIKVVRVPTIIAQNAGTFIRIIDFLSFMISCGIAGMVVRRPNVVIATSPQFFTAVAGWFIAAIRRCPFVFELRDFWPDSIVAVGAMREGFAIRCIRRVEEFLYARANAIVAVTHSFKTTLIERGVSEAKIIVVPNGAELKAMTPGPKPVELVESLGLRGRFVVSYIGTIGLAHGLEVLLDAAALLVDTLPQARFIVVGSGAERDRIRARALQENLTTILFIDSVRHGDIIKYWRLSDVTLVLLKDQPLFRTVIPSKIFEAMAVGVPIIANVRGESEQLLAAADAAELIPPANAVALAAAIERLACDLGRRTSLAERGHEVVKSYSRPILAQQVLDLLYSTHVP